MHHNVLPVAIDVAFGGPLNMLMTTDWILAVTAVTALAFAAWFLTYRYHRQSSLQRGRDGRCVDAWTELQQACMVLVEQDERGGASVDELHRAAARYHSVIGDISVREAARQMSEPKQIPLLF
jgi:hypothetical protein